MKDALVGKDALPAVAAVVDAYVMGGQEANYSRPKSQCLHSSSTGSNGVSKAIAQHFHWEVHCLFPATLDHLASSPVSTFVR